VSTYPKEELVSSKRVLVVGDVMLDRYWFGAVERISPEAPVAVLHVQSEQDRLGGAANVALNIRTLGGQATLLSMVGNDDAAKRIRHLLNEQGVLAALSEHTGLQTTIKLRVIGRNQQLMRIDFEQKPNREVIGQMLANYESELYRHDVVLFSDYGKGALTDISLMIELARAAGKPVLVDPKGGDYARYAGASVITPNRPELMLVVGAWQSEQDLEYKAKQLMANLGLDALLLTRSEEGMTLFEPDNVFHIKAQVREVADVTGAGDTVIATLALMVACGLPMLNAIEIANRAAGMVVAKFGTSTLNYEELFS
jgi:rfaE bifunctional protein kinase chain/domain